MLNEALGIANAPEISLAIWAELLNRVPPNSFSASVNRVLNEALETVNAPEMSEAIWAELLRAPLKIPVNWFAIIVPLALMLFEAVMFVNVWRELE